MILFIFFMVSSIWLNAQDRSALLSIAESPKYQEVLKLSDAYYLKKGIPLEADALIKLHKQSFLSESARDYSFYATLDLQTRQDIYDCIRLDNKKVHAYNFIFPGLGNWIANSDRNQLVSFFGKNLWMLPNVLVTASSIVNTGVWIYAISTSWELFWLPLGINVVVFGLSEFIYMSSANQYHRWWKELLLNDAPYFSGQSMTRSSGLNLSFPVYFISF